MKEYLVPIILCAIGFLIWISRIAYLQIMGLCPSCYCKLENCKCDWTMEYY